MLSNAMNDGKPIAVSDYTWLDIGTIAGIPSAVFLLIVVFVLAGFVLKYTPFGRYVYAIGSNTETAFWEREARVKEVHA